MDFEDLLGGRILGWLGGSAVVLAAVFFLVMAVSRGWIDEPTRVLLAFLGSTLLLGVGLYLYERQGQTQAALATVAAAIAVALRLADRRDDALRPDRPGRRPRRGGSRGRERDGDRSSLELSDRRRPRRGRRPARRPSSSTRARRARRSRSWRSRWPRRPAVLLWQRWDWLAAVSFVVSAPQVVGWLFDTHEEHPVRALVVLGLFWALYVVAAIGYELRVPTPSCARRRRCSCSPTPSSSRPAAT